jgi:hypothetical protein
MILVRSPTKWHHLMFSRYLLDDNSAELMMMRYRDGSEKNHMKFE